MKNKIENVFVLINLFFAIIVLTLSFSEQKIFDFGEHNLSEKYLPFIAGCNFLLTAGFLFIGVYKKISFTFQLPGRMIQSFFLITVLYSVFNFDKVIHRPVLVVYFISLLLFTLIISFCRYKQ
jgi:hypothetical protein